MRAQLVSAPPASVGAMDVRAWIMLIALSWLWGGSFFLAAVAVADVPPLTVVLARLVLSSLLLAAIVRATGRCFPDRARVWGELAVMGAFNSAVPFALIFWSQTRIASGLASILVTTTPLFTVVFAHAVTGDERLTPSRLLGALLGLAGVAAMVGMDAIHGIGDVTAQLAVLAAAACYAASGLYGRRLHGLPPVVAAAGQTACGALLLLPLVLLADQPWRLPAPRPESWAAIVGLAALCTALAYVLYFRILAAAGATNASLVTFLVPVAAITLGTAVLGEALQLRHLAGMAMIALGLAAIDGRAVRWITRRFRERRPVRRG